MAAKRPSVDQRQHALNAQYPIWFPRCLHEVLSDAAERWPDREFLRAEGVSYSYRDIKVWAERIAAGLYQAGVRSGDHVAIVMANCPEFVALKFAISRVGATAVPINFLNRTNELAYVLEQSDARCLITMDRFRDLDYLAMLDQIIPGWREGPGGDRLPELQSIFVLPTAGETLPSGVAGFAGLEASEGMAPDIDADPQSPSDIIYTSGTTGGPKGVLLTHDMLLRAAYGSAYARGFEDGQRILFSLPMYHVYGYVEGLLAAMMVGGTAIVRRLFDVEDTLRAIEDERADDILLIPTMTLALLDNIEGRGRAVSGLKSMLSSGGKAPADIWHRIRAGFGDIEITTGYGMSEATASSTVTRPDDPVERLLQTNGRLRDVGVAGDPDNDGKLVVYRVVDTQTGEEVPAGVMGELRMKGIGVTSGYYNKPEETAAAFDEQGWFKTGDLGTLDEDGYITLKGRTKESYRCGGELVLPLEVENVLASHPDIDEVHVVAIPDKRMGEVGVACVVTTRPLDVDEGILLEFCRERLARFKVPRHVLFITPEELPTTPTGRPRKFLLAQQVQITLAARQQGNES